MLKNYFIIAWRNIIRNKWFALVSFLGLGLSMAVYIFINVYVDYHKGFEKFNKDRDRVYRVGQTWIKDGEVEDGAPNLYAVGPALKENIPEIEEQVRIHAWYGKCILEIGTNTLAQTNVYYTEPSFFDIFSFPLIEGAKGSVFQDKSDVVISKTTAFRLFGKESPLGKVINLKSGDRSLSLTVKGVMDVPGNSHFQPEILVNYDLLGAFGDENWVWSGVHLYIKLKENARLNDVIAKYPAVLKPHESIWKSEGYDIKFSFDRIDKIHTGKPRFLTLGNSIDGTTLNFLLILAWVILGISWINYIHLSTSRTKERAKEVGIRKVLGSGRSSFYLQFLIEGILHNVLAFALAFTLFQAFSILIYHALGVNIPLEGIFGSNIYECLFVLLLGSFITGLVPAFSFNSLRVIRILKGNQPLGDTNKTSFRNVTVILQFASSTFLIIASWVIYNQIDYLKAQDPGFDLSKILVVEKPVVTDSSFGVQMEGFKHQLQLLADVKSVSLTSDIPGSRLMNNVTNIHKPQAKVSEINSNYLMDVDDNFIKTYGLNLLAGRSFNSSDMKYGKAMIINEAAVKNLGFSSVEEAIGASMVWEGFKDPNGFKIVGVIKNYKHEAAQYKILPTIYTAYENPEFVSIKINTVHVSATLNEIADTYKQFFQDKSPVYYFLDTHYAQQYRQDEKLGQFTTVLCMIAIVLSCIGLFSLTAFYLDLKKKEVSIRKVMGASVTQLFGMLTWRFIQLIILAGLLGVPIVYYVGNEWLKNYQVRISIGFTMLLLPVLVIVIVALISIAYQTLKVAFLNPVHNLKEE